MITLLEVGAVVSRTEYSSPTVEHSLFLAVETNARNYGPHIARLFEITCFGLNAAFSEQAGAVERVRFREVFWGEIPRGVTDEVVLERNFRSAI